MARFPYGRNEEVKRWLLKEKQYFLNPPIPEELRITRPYLHQVGCSPFVEHVSYLKRKGFYYVLCTNDARGEFWLDQVKELSGERIKQIEKKRQFFHYPAADDIGELAISDFLPCNRKNYVRLWDFNLQKYVEVRFYEMKKENQCRTDLKTHYLIYNDSIHYFDAERFYEIVNILNDWSKGWTGTKLFREYKFTLTLSNKTARQETTTSTKKKSKQSH